MNRRLAVMAAPLVIAALAGCRMCQAPFDYCAPTIGPSGCFNCDFLARRGSAFRPMDDDPQYRRSTAKAVPGMVGATEEGEPSIAAPTGEAADSGESLPQTYDATQ